MRTPTIKKLLREAGLLVPSVEALVSYNAREIEVRPFDGGFDIVADDNVCEGEATDELLDAILDVLETKYSLSGYCTGYGSWVMSEDYVSKGDWNDKASAHHY